jgi:hypothetical protein
VIDFRRGSSGRVPGGPVRIPGQAQHRPGSAQNLDLSRFEWDHLEVRVVTAGLDSLSLVMLHFML